jgi:hypothetical protein
MAEADMKEIPDDYINKLNVKKRKKKKKKK